MGTNPVQGPTGASVGRMARVPALDLVLFAREDPAERYEMDEWQLAELVALHGIERHLVAFEEDGALFVLDGVRRLGLARRFGFGEVPVRILEGPLGEDREPLRELCNAYDRRLPGSARRALLSRSRKWVKSRLRAGCSWGKGGPGASASVAELSGRGIATIYRDIALAERLDPGLACYVDSGALPVEYAASRIARSLGPDEQARLAEELSHMDVRGTADIEAAMASISGTAAGTGELVRDVLDGLVELERRAQGAAAARIALARAELEEAVRREGWA